MENFFFCAVYDSDYYNSFHQKLESIHYNAKLTMTTGAQEKRQQKSLHKICTPGI